jgi:TRAP-type C4-dicarboxylate transport system permease small subunit
MGAWDYYRLLLHRAASEVLDVIGWRTTPLIVIFAGVLVWAFTMLLFSRIENESNVFAQLKWHIAGMVAIVYVAMSLFVFFVALAPFRIAKEAETKLATAKVDADTRVAAAQADADRPSAAIRVIFQEHSPTEP